jgi:hypothetical protein
MNIPAKDENLPSPRVLSCFLAPRERYRPVLFSRNEIFCGPDCITTREGDRYLTIQTPAGVYDIEPFAKDLPLSQKPELFVVKADATGRNFPINLKVLKCPKLLIVGNTQHMKRPIRKLLNYALQEDFDFIMSDHKRHHLHYFKEAGFDNVFWLPAFNLNPHEQPLFEEYHYPVSFVGQAGRWHPYRKYLLDRLRAKGVQINHFSVPQDEAAQIYSRSLINLNCSLNGDLNLRVFEVLSSGGFLLTDRLSEESGLELLFNDGEHLVCFKNEKDLLEKIGYFLGHPDEAKEIARNGYEEFKRNHTPEKKIRELMDYVFKGELNPLYEIHKDERSDPAEGQPSSALMERVSLYEFFQELHLANTNPSVLFWPGVDPRLARDVTDLPRLKLRTKTDGVHL